MVASKALCSRFWQEVGCSPVQRPITYVIIITRHRDEFSISGNLITISELNRAHGLESTYVISQVELSGSQCEKRLLLLSFSLLTSPRFHLPRRIYLGPVPTTGAHPISDPGRPQRLPDNPL
jgi:hypothetical protein